MMELSKPARATCTLLRLFWWESDRSVRAEAVLRLAAVVSVLLFRGKAGVWLSTIRRQQTQELLRREASSRSVLRYLGALVLLSPVSKIYWRLLRGLRLQWERHLTQHFLVRFLDAQCLGQRFGRPEQEECGSRHPDQRIAADVGKFVQLATSLSLDSLQAGIDLYFYSALLRGISPALSKTALLAAAAGTLVVRFLGRNLPALYGAERFADGNFTYVLTRMRENAESIAFYGGQQHEVKLASDALDLRQNTEWVRLAEKDVVQHFSDQYRQILSLSPALLLVQSSAAGASVDAAVLAQASEAFDIVTRRLMILSENWSDFSRLNTVALELYAYHLEQSNLDSSEGGICLSPLQADYGHVGQTWLSLEDLSLWAGDRILVSSLSFAAPSKGGLLITGQSGSGKTTLLRAIAGLLRGQGGSGHVRRDMAPGHVLFLSQRPYMTLGTLREQLSYPFGFAAGVDDAALCGILKRLGLDHIVLQSKGSLDVVSRWDEILSLGEQQRLSVARILAQRPMYAVLDEITSANDPQHEANMYSCIALTCSAFLSVGHRASLEAFHSRRLRLLGTDGRWELEALS
ncbi:unnamed protein product [Polarella glacialis]|uniref:ABC transporter domain-containing protein n=1 Tax=Polarella glacialis TaxID=89957 RepID=A0A813H120_POLGL|nr:unnamed protein product [Polarella glacialis]